MIYDGTCWDGLPFLAALEDRKHYGHGYRNETLEAKRRQAIEWLRQSSRTGWACDKVKEKASG